MFFVLVATKLFFSQAFKYDASLSSPNKEIELYMEFDNLHGLEFDKACRLSNSGRRTLLTCRKLD